MGFSLRANENTWLKQQYNTWYVYGLVITTLLQLLNQGNVQAIANQFLRWDKAGGRTLVGLTRRQNAERALFLSQDLTAFLT